MVRMGQIWGKYGANMVQIWCGWESKKEIFIMHPLLLNELLAFSFCFITCYTNAVGRTHETVHSVSFDKRNAQIHESIFELGASVNLGLPFEQIRFEIPILKIGSYECL